ncbi:S8 family serine peptidase [Salinigranum sp. GCM10025319]|uniref:S8 family serine peptidase n=1 Tax=Salinigranum sp. GCM10025319 TaxID=3252687 RepID=UPI003622FCEF
MSDKEKRSINRRELLRTIGASAVVGVAGTGVAGATPTGRYVVGTKNNRGLQKAKQVASDVHRELDFGDVGQAVAGRFPEQARKALEKNPNIRYIEADGRMEAVAQSLPWGVDRTDSDLTQDAGYTGEGADIAIIDSGIDADHPDLQANLGNGKAFAYCSGCAESWDDDNDHGTHCAGIAAAVDNSEAVVGVAPSATLHAVKVLTSNGWGSYSDIAAGIQYVGDQGWDVASMSLGGSSYSYSVADAVEYATSQGVLCIAAAGNSGPCSDCVLFPATHPDVVAVSATDSGDGLAYFSSTGSEIDIAAPGYSILSTVSGGGTAYFSGTSMACPHVAGAAGVLMANGYSNTEARARLEETAEDIGLSGNEQGSGLLDVEAAMGSDDGNNRPSINIVAPSDGAVVNGTVTIEVDASDVEDDEGSLSVEVVVDGGQWRTATYVSSLGLYEYDWDTSSVSDGSHVIGARATDSRDNTAESNTVGVTTDNTQTSVDLPSVDTTANRNASFSGSGGDYTIAGSGVDVWKRDDDYAAVYHDDVSGDVVASVTVESQENTHQWAKAGLMIANDITAPGSSAGDLLLATTPENGYALQWDSDGDGYVDTSEHTGNVSYPAELRVTKSGTEFTGEYSTDGGSSWTTIATVTIPEARSTQDVGLFVRGSRTDENGQAEFTGFDVAASSPSPSIDLPTADTTANGDASFSGSGGDYTIAGSGVDVWKRDDDYAAVYHDDVSGDVVASVTVESQENTHQWAKAGLMIANDITAPGSSAGDLLLATTPENGYALQWDSDGDGYVDTSEHTGNVSYPAELRVTKSGTEFTGEYSTDGGSSWTTIATVTIPEARSTQDVGLFVRGSRTDENGQAEFTGFDVAASE